MLLDSHMWVHNIATTYSLAVLKMSALKLRGDACRTHLDQSLTETFGAELCSLTRRIIK